MVPHIHVGWTNFGRERAALAVLLFLNLEAVGLLLLYVLLLIFTKYSKCFDQKEYIVSDLEWTDSDFLGGRVLVFFYDGLLNIGAEYDLCTIIYISKVKFLALADQCSSK